MMQWANRIARDAYLTFSAAHGYEEQEPACEYARWYHLLYLLIPIIGILPFMLSVDNTYAIRTRRRQTTFIYCRGCGNELCSDDSFVSDMYDSQGDNHVKYKCRKCGEESDYNFDIAPVPVNWLNLKKE